MKKSSQQKLIPGFFWLAMFYLFSTAWNPLFGQSVSCESNTLSLGIDCTAVIDPNLVLQPDAADQSLYSVSVNGSAFVPSFTVSTIGVYNVIVRLNSNNNTCGPVTITVEDKLGPVITCADVHVDCAATIPVNRPTAVDACCGTIPPSGFSYFDLPTGSVVSNFDGPFAPANWTKTVTPGTGESITFNYLATAVTLVGDSFGPYNVGNPCSNPDVGNPACYTATLCIDVPISGTVTFDWLNERAPGSVNFAPGFDPTAYSITLAGGATTYVNLSTDAITSGTVSNLPLTAGDQFCFIIGSNGFSALSQAVFDNFSFDPVVADPCTGDYILRRWTATDCHNNTRSCIQTILLDPVPFSCPADLRGLNALDCAVSFPTDADGHPHPDFTGKPQGCNILYVYTDQVITPAGCQAATNVGCYFVLRTWTVSDQCTMNKTTCLQSIEVADHQGPSIQGVADVTISTTSDGCEANYYVPEPLLTDNCSDVSGYTVTATAGSVSYLPVIGRYVITGLPQGTTMLKYRATDCCGNATEKIINVTVEDLVPPNVTCESFRTVSLTIDGTGRILAPAFDDGSNDNCSPQLWFKVIRMDDLSGSLNGVKFGITGDCVSLNGDDNPARSGTQVWFDDDVFFCCEDVGGPNVMTVLRVFDVDPGPGPISPNRMDPGGDLVGHFNDCMVEVTVDDKLPPLITCPPNITVSCGFWFDYNNLGSVFGTVVTDALQQQYITINDPGNTDFPQPHIWGRDGLAYDNCSVTVTEGKLNDLQCGQGTITRIFTATDGIGRTASCVQRITIRDYSPFYITDTNSNNTNPNDGVIWPANYTTNSCGASTDPSVTGEPLIFGDDACALISVVNSDTPIDFDNTPGASSCLILQRTWIVTDLCHYPPPVPNPTGNPGRWTYTQVIRVQDNDAPVFDPCDDITFEAFNFNNNCKAAVSLSNSATDNCAASSDLIYTYAVDIDNTTPPYTFEKMGNGNSFTVRLPVGTHTVVWKAEDGCGNIGDCVQLLTVVDKENPIAKGAGIRVDVQPVTQQVSVAAMMLDAGSFDECGTIAAFRIGPAMGPGQTTPPATTSLTFDCNDLGLQQVDFWVSDLAGNWDYVQVVVDVQNNMNACPTNTPGTIAGLVRNEVGNRVEGVKVAVGDALFDYTSVDGEYLLSNLTMHHDYQVTPRLNNDHRNGVTTLDLVLISRHLIGLQPLNTPYKIIAADIDHSGEINSFDIIELQKLILYISNNFPNNTSWRFVDESFVFPNPANPFASTFPEIYNIPSLDNDMQDVDFVAVKIGDVNGSVSTSSLAPAEERTFTGTLPLEVTDQNLRADEWYTIDVRANNFSDLLGFQFGLDFDPLAMECSVLTTDQLAGFGEANFGKNNIEEGTLLTSWANARPQTLADGTVIFQLKIKAKNNARLSDLLTISSTQLAAEAYRLSAEGAAPDLLLPQLDFGQNNQFGTDFALFQNRPNPFKNETVVAFFLPETTTAKLTVYDMSGKALQVIEQSFDKGYHELTFRSTDLNAAGVLYYQLETPTSSATRKMILLE